MRHDVIVIGGSYAGMAAGLQLLRAHRTVLMIDAGQRRNRSAETAHGFLGQDGVNPGQIAAAARQQLERYPTLRWIDALADVAEGQRDAFVVTTSDGARHEGRRLLFATGVVDRLPEIGGIQERWGKSVFHCPYCHGYELNRGQIGIIAVGPISLHQALLLPEWGEVTLLTNGDSTLDAGQRGELASRNVKLEQASIARIEGHADVRLADGRLLSFAGLFTVPRNAPSTPIAERLGCALEGTPFGVQIKTDETKETTIAGAFACGDAARAPHSISLAVGDGAWAGAHAHRSLVL